VLPTQMGPEILGGLELRERSAFRGKRTSGDRKPHMVVVYVGLQLRRCIVDVDIAGIWGVGTLSLFPGAMNVDQVGFQAFLVCHSYRTTFLSARDFVYDPSGKPRLTCVDKSSREYAYKLRLWRYSRTRKPSSCTSIGTSSARPGCFLGHAGAPPPSSLRRTDKA
jgi:hypothetical protein